ncbi:MAG: diheme cytochrome c [Gammaproteobacteria bacterium]|nr:diheme cytochrome c [Gammaproteobacteria bacterium]
MRRKMLIGSLIIGAGLGLGWILTGAGELRAEEDDEHGRRHEREHEHEEEDRGWRAPAAGPGQDSYMSECGSCHVSYPPGLLGARQWAVIMTHLNDHYGESATMTPETARTLAAYLQANAGRDGGSGAAADEELPRITTSAWFRDEHDEIGPEVWRRESIRSAANCGACHGGAEQGVYDEDGVRIPR